MSCEQTMLKLWRSSCHLQRRTSSWEGRPCQECCWFFLFCVRHTTLQMMSELTTQCALALLVLDTRLVELNCCAAFIRSVVNFSCLWMRSCDINNELINELVFVSALLVRGSGLAEWLNYDAAVARIVVGFLWFAPIRKSVIFSNTALLVCAKQREYRGMLAVIPLLMSTRQTAGLWQISLCNILCLSTPNHGLMINVHTLGRTARGTTQLVSSKLSSFSVKLPRFQTCFTKARSCGNYSVMSLGPSC